MAVTKIHAIKSTVNKALKYILDPSKTDGTLLASGFNCEPVTAHLDFKMTSQLAGKLKGDYKGTGGADIQAFHVIQSFAKTDDLTPERAHEVGKLLADEFFDHKHEYVLTTHIDKEHIHNHIIANAVSFLDFKKFRSQPYVTVRRLREVSDKLCREYGLNVIAMPQGRGDKSKMWGTQPSWRDKIQLAVDKAIYSASDYKEFKDILTRQGIEIKEGKHIAFRLPGQGQQRFIRGKSIGPRYERGMILSRIREPNKTNVVTVLPVSKIEKQIYRRSRKEILQSVHEIGAMMMLTRRENINAYRDFDLKVTDLKHHLAKTRDKLKELGEKNSIYQNTAKLLVTYNDFLPLYQEYEKLPGWRRAKFLKENGDFLDVFLHAKEALEKDNSRHVDVDGIIAIMKEQSQKTQELQNYFYEIEQRIEAISKAKEVMTRVLGRDLDQEQARSQASQEQKKDRGISR